MLGTPQSGAPAPGLPTILDIEASGFGPGSYPIEVGLVLPDGDAWCSLIRPEPGWLHWDPSAEQVHGTKVALVGDIGCEVMLRVGSAACVSPSTPGLIDETTGGT